MFEKKYVKETLKKHNNNAVNLEKQREEEAKTLTRVKEKHLLRRFNMEQNLEREKRKLEWKKLNVMAKDKLIDEKREFTKRQSSLIQKAKVELDLQKMIEKERVQKAMVKFRNVDFYDKG